MTDSFLPIEREISTIIKTRRIRICEFFKDFDRLRSGKITTFQFTRCLNQVFGSARSDGMTQTEEELLIKKYGDKNNEVDYKRFTDTIQGVFDPHDMTSLPSSQIINTTEYLGDRNQNVSDATLIVVDRTLKQLEPFYEYHGIDIRQCFQDFAKHNNGRITASQFKRNFPGSETIASTDIDALAEYYTCSMTDFVPTGTTASPLVNYLNFYLDIEDLRKKRKWWIGRSNTVESTTDRDNAGQVQQNAGDNAGMDNELQSLFSRLHVAIFKNRIRTTEFFRDHDKLRSGIITRNQFIRGLTLAQDGVQLGASLLTGEEIKRIADYYSDANGMVRYKKFCYKMENTFNIPNLEKQPTLNPVRPSPKQLQTKLTELNPEEESRIQQLIHDIREYVTKRRIMLYPYFKDFDRGAGYTRTVTKGQFARILNFSSIKLAPTDLELIYRKYRDPVTGDVLYPAFSIAVESEFCEYMRCKEDFSRYGLSESTWVDPEEQRQKRRQQISSKPRERKMVHQTVQQSLASIVEYLYKNRVRGEVFFQDFDQLRSGLVTESIFLRCLDSMGITDISCQESKELANHYRDSDKTDCIGWQDFLEDVTTLHDSPELFSNTYGLPPEPSVPKAEIKGKTHFKNLSESEQRVAREVLQRFCDRVSQRRLLPKPVYQDFDRHNHGYVTIAQANQVLCTLQLGCSEEESHVLTKLFADNVGFNYEEFLQVISPSNPLETKYEGQLKELQSLGIKKTKMATGVESERYTAMLRGDVLERAMTRIKTLVFKERIRVYEWMKDYDKLRSGAILKNSFRRALDLCGAADVLIEPEMIAVMDHYKHPKDSDRVRYLNFCEELETVFTVPHLDKNPLTEVKQFKPPVEWERNDLEPIEETIYQMAMQRLSEHIKKTRIQLHPLFEDYDRVHNGTVSRSQFHRVLSELEMGGLLSEQEFRVIFKRFNMTKGGKNDVNYVAFCDWFNDTDDLFVANQHASCNA